MLNSDWVFDVNAAYIYEYEGSPADQFYTDVLNIDKILYQGPSLRVGAISLYPSGINPLRTDYNELELLYRYLWYTEVDFIDDPDSGKVFNISENMHVAGLSWIAGYEFVKSNNFKLDCYLGFGIQMRFSDITVNSYGYDFDSDMYVLNDHNNATRLVPMLNAGVHIGVFTGKSIAKE
ncbi:MAG: hypothetical protein H7Y00_12360 [Fimbriimonadaceae bacterium]|nr:hypothetical protein [Chitinophagales bacterium]